MIWFGPKAPNAATLPRPLPDRSLGDSTSRMYRALAEVAAHSPHLFGRPLVQALAESGWVSEAEAERLLPCFPRWDPDRSFAEALRRLSFRGLGVADEFRSRVARAMADIVGDARVSEDEGLVRWEAGERIGVVLAYPEVDWTVGGEARTTLARVAEEMPDSVAVVARSFRETAASEVRSLLGPEVPGTLVSVNLLLGLRAAALRHQPPTSRMLELLGLGRSLRSVDLAVLGER